MHMLLNMEKITCVSKLVIGRNICLALWTFMKKLANMNKPAEGTFVTHESENSSWTFASQILQMVSLIT